MLALTLAPAVVSMLVLAAHFLRRGQWLPCAACIAAAALALVRRPWASLALRFCLALGTLEWVRTTVQLVRARAAEGGPVVRLVVIMAAVIAVTLAGLVLLESAPAARHFRRVA